MPFTTLQQQFIQPSDEFTPIPFWFWNDDLTAEEIVRQIQDFTGKGVMGFVLHPRLGIPKKLTYLSDEFMDLVEVAVKEAARRGMQVILYDEAMYPSGSANGRVVQGNPEFASRGLKMLTFHPEADIRLPEVLEPGDTLVSAQAVQLQSGAINGDSTVILDTTQGVVRFTPPDGAEWSIVLFVETFTRGTIRGIHFGQDDGEPDAPASSDLLNPLAVQKFIRLTHERYYERVGSYFGSTIIAMFTDEPDILGRGHTKELQAWTNGFMDDFTRSGCREEELPLLWLDGMEASRVRAAYRKAVNARLTEMYYKPLSEWCRDHGIAFTGHPAASDDIGLQEQFHIPGQDVVWRWVAPEDGTALEGHHSTAAKCSADAARHRGRRRNLNEFLGVCGRGNGWVLSAGDMKWYIDWLTVRGVNLLSPHAFYYSIDGDRMFERPPDVGPNNIWWPHYLSFAQYMKRMSWLMTDSVNVTPVAVLCKEDWLPWRITKPLYQNQVEFNYLEERLLYSACTVEEGQIRIAAQTYSVVLVESPEVMEEQGLAVLEPFISQGGRVIVLGDRGTSPSLHAAVEVRDPVDVVAALDRLFKRDVRFDGDSRFVRVSHVVKEGSHFYMIVNEGEDAAYEGTMRVSLKGGLEQWEPWDGTVSAASAVPVDDGMHISVRLEPRGSVIYHVNPDEPMRAADDADSVPAGEVRQELNDSWRIGLLGEPLLPGEPGNWTAQEELADFSGTMVYTRQLHLDNPPSLHQAALLDLGEVHELAEVWVNGESAGVKMWPPYVFDIRPWLKAGDNELRIHVTNALANRYEQAGLPSGLLGPVTLSAVSGIANPNQ
ncbi:glycosylhydrolase-like jelly roll fold domain-containing protein [Paenibacillus sp. y28]|uniref:glycosylhydrolase-like jelly roll fold domain-containing protein n=1 Tax=Paenibacillus sp. y28 TaxID=3129110 RepID=UPI0030184E6D